MLIYDTLSEKKKRLARPKTGPLKMFVCGPTVYNYAHIGHARTYIVFDVIARWLRHRGFSLYYLQNITDIDDKIPDLKTARHFEKEYLKDMKTLRVENVDRYARAGDHLPEIKKQIQTLLDKGFAYRTNSGIYFEVKKFPAYGQLSKQNLDQLRPGWRIEPDPQKKDPLDFALWKFTKKEGRGSNFKFQISNSYPSPWSRGRPGWHIEDTAISEKYLGSQYDLHGAAVDLKFPHHESEIAQQESISGKKPLVRIWLHAGFLLVNNEKMSKSLGNFITIKDFLKKYPVNVLRLLIASHHYRSPISYTDELAKQQQNAWKNIEKFMRTIILAKASQRRLFQSLKRKTRKEFVQAMDDDFNTPKALAALFNFMAASPKIEEAKRFLADQLAVLGLIIRPPKVPAAVARLLAERGRYRLEKNFRKADIIRNQIQKQGFYTED